VARRDFRISLERLGNKALRPYRKETPRVLADELGCGVVHGGMQGQDELDEAR
jgi:hypothetical protein